MSVTLAQFRSATAGVGDSADAQLLVDQMNAGPGVVATVSAPLVLTGSALGAPTLTAATAAIAAGTCDTETKTTAGALSVTKSKSVLNPSGAAAYTLAAGSDGQRKYIELIATHAVTVSNIIAQTGGAAGLFTLGTAGDYLEAVYSAALGGWRISSFYVD